MGSISIIIIDPGKYCLHNQGNQDMPPLSIRNQYLNIYRQRVEKALQLIDSHLSDPLDLDKLACEASFSPFHFHRIFTALMGESPLVYINRQRLEKSANLLVKSPSLTITEVALQVGFSTPSNFARSFKQYFGCTATSYAQQNRSQSGPYPWIARDSIPNKKESFHLPQVTVKPMAALHLAYFPSRHGYSPASIKDVWTKTFNWAASRKIDLNNEKLVAISFDDPEITPPSKCRYFACLTVPGELTSDSRAYFYDFPDHLCAVCRIECDADEIQPAYRSIYREWLPESGFLLADLPPYEVYFDAPDAHPGSKYVFDLCIPVENT